MPSSPKIQKELILQTALDILIHEGYSAINIKRIARELGCSTQPISWQFGGMDGFRAELTEAAAQYMNRKIVAAGSNAVAAFEHSGKEYLDLAIDEPNLFRFLLMGESGKSVPDGFTSLLSYSLSEEELADFSRTLGLSSEQSEAFTSMMVIYTHGIATLIVAGVVKGRREDFHTMVREAGVRYLCSLGLERDRLSALLGD